MAYPTPNWIRPPEDLAAAYLNAYRAGASVAEAQARLDTEAQERGVNLAVTEQRMQQQNMRDQQELEMKKALSQAELGIRQASLQNAQERIAMTAQAAASRMAEQQAFLKEREAGVDPFEAMLRHPGMFTSAAPLTSVAKEVAERSSPFQPEDVTTPGGVPLVRVGPRHYVLAPKKTPTGGAQAGPVVGPDGKPIPGMVSIDGRARNVPGYKDPVQHEIALIEKVWGPQLQGQFDVGKEQQAAFDKAQKRYAQLKAIQASGGAPSSASPPTTAAPAAASMEEVAARASKYKVGGHYPFPDGSVRVFQGGDPNVESNWQKEK